MCPPEIETCVIPGHREADLNKGARTASAVGTLVERTTLFAALATMDNATADAGVYFADPHSPWPRGLNENTNGLLRHYFPRGANLSGFTQAELDTVAWRLNTRPRHVLCDLGEDG